jgi:hypothetical protein
MALGSAGLPVPSLADGQGPPSVSAAGQAAPWSATKLVEMRAADALPRPSPSVPPAPSTSAMLPPVGEDADALAAAAAASSSRGGLLFSLGTARGPPSSRVTLGLLLAPPGSSSAARTFTTTSGTSGRTPGGGALLSTATGSLGERGSDAASQPASQLLNSNRGSGGSRAPGSTALAGAPARPGGPRGGGSAHSGTTPTKTPVASGGPSLVRRRRSLASLGSGLQVRRERRVAHYHTSVASSFELFSTQ